MSMYMIFCTFCVTNLNLIVHKSEDKILTSAKEANKIVKVLLHPEIQLFCETLVVLCQFGFIQKSCRKKS